MAAVITAATLAMAGAIILTATSALAINPCMGDNPPSSCDTNPGGPLPTKPLAPSSLSATGILQTEVDLHWVDGANNETGYTVVRNDPNANTYVSFQLPANSTDYADHTAQPSHYYTYSVSALRCDANDRCNASSAVSVNVQLHEQPASPYGSYSAATTSYYSTWPMSGWVIDWDTTAAIQVNLVIDGQVSQSMTANLASSGLNSTNPGYGDNHGYSFSPVKPTNKGSHSLCVVAVNVGGGHDVQLGCRTFVVNGPPSAVTNVVARNNGGNSVTISFTDNANDESGYTLERSDGQGNYPSIQNNPAVPGSGSTVTITDQSKYVTQVCYIIVMTNQYGSSSSAPGCTS